MYKRFSRSVLKDDKALKIFCYLSVISEKAEALIFLIYIY